MPFPNKLLVAAALVSSACVSSLPGQPLAMRPPELLSTPVPPPPFTRQGEIQYTPFGTAGSSAAWDAHSVRGPAVNLTLTEEGLWGGTIQDHVVLLHARNGRITGEGVDIGMTQDGSTVRVRGLWFGRLVGISFTSDTISASPFTGVCAAELSLAPDGLWRGFGGCGGALDYIWMSLKGVAADPGAEMPQWLFAFLGALPAPQVSTFRPGVTAAAGVGVGGGGFLPAEFRALFGYWGEPPGPCSAWDQRLCGPWGYTGLVPVVYVPSSIAAGSDGQVRSGGRTGGAGRHAAFSPGSGSRDRSTGSAPSGRAGQAAHAPQSAPASNPARGSTSDGSSGPRGGAEGRTARAGSP
jgi:hypothetical protein